MNSSPISVRALGAERRRKIMTFFERHQEAHGVAPTMREIMTACDIRSSSVVQHHVDRLVRDRRLVRVAGKGHRKLAMPSARTQDLSVHDETREQAFIMLQALIDRDLVYRKANAAIRRAIGDTTAEFTHGLNVIDGHLHTALCRFIDVILGHAGADLTSYFLCEGLDGGIASVHCCGHDWPLKSLDQFRTYIRHCDECAGRQADKGGQNAQRAAA